MYMRSNYFFFSLIRHIFYWRDNIVYDIYIVKNGDTLESLAKTFKIPIYEIMRLNNLQNVYELTVGQELKVPVVSSSAFQYYTVKKGDTVYGIAKEYGISPNLLLILNGIGANDYIYPNQQILVPKKDFVLYITKTGDSLQSIMNNNSINEQDLLNYNEQIYLVPNQLIIFKKEI